MGAAYVNLQVNSKYQVGYNILYLTRRILYVFILFNSFCVKYQIIQVLMLTYLNLFCFAYVVQHRPFLTKQRNQTEILNELSVSITTESMLFYTGLLDPDTQNRIGWASVALFCATLIINFLVVQYNILRKIYFIMLGKYKRWIHSKEHKMDDIISEQQEDIIYPTLLDQMNICETLTSPQNMNLYVN